MIEFTQQIDFVLKITFEPDFNKFSFYYFFLVWSDLHFDWEFNN